MHENWDKSQDNTTAAADSKMLDYFRFYTSNFIQFGHQSLSLETLLCYIHA
jgi:hypothetical protein